MTPPKKTEQAKLGALDLLKADHDKIRALFREFEQLKGIEEQEERKVEITEEICYELSLHAALEEEIFYPAVRSLVDNDELIDEAELEHAGARELINQLEVMYPGDEHYEATVAVLNDEVERHIEKEEGIIFSAVKMATLDMLHIGERMQERKAQLEEDLSSPPSTINGLGGDDEDDEHAHIGHGPS
jgi:iron-sulfur cluster repair protein YtfE (RIC family)